MSTLEIKGSLVIHGGLNFTSTEGGTSEIYYITGDHYKCNMGSYAYHVFTSSGTYQLLFATNLEYFLVSCGGSGLTSSTREWGGGGAQSINTDGGSGIIIIRYLIT